MLLYYLDSTPSDFPERILFRERYAKMGKLERHIFRIWDWNRFKGKTIVKDSTVFRDWWYCSQGCSEDFLSEFYSEDDPRFKHLAVEMTTRVNFSLSYISHIFTQPKYEPVCTWGDFKLAGGF